MQQQFSFSQSPVSSSSRNSAHSARAIGNASTIRPSAPAAPNHDELTRVFSTALVNSHIQPKKNFSSELKELTNSLSFKAILNSIQQLARAQGITEKQATEQLIQTFRKMDVLWQDYLIQEGVEKIRCRTTAARRK